MKNHKKSIEEINQRIDDGNARVVTASEMTRIVAEIGADNAVHEVDVVTTGTFGAMCSSGVWMNFGHSEPPIKMSRVWLNDVEAYTSVAAVDAYLGATQVSKTRGIEYGGGHVIEDLVRGKPVHLHAEGVGTDCYPLRTLSVGIQLEETNQAIMSNPRNCYERYAVAANSSKQSLNTYMGKLLPELENATYSGAGELSPIINDPKFRTIGIGTRIFLGGAQGYIVGSGTQHNPRLGFSTLMVQGDLKRMSSEFLRGATLTDYGPTLYVGVGVPIPIINADVARSTGVSDSEILTSVLDYSVQSRDRPTLARVSYEELRSGMIEVNGKDVRTSSLSSLKVAERIANHLRNLIMQRKFFLTQAVKFLSLESTAFPMRAHIKPERAVMKAKTSSNLEYYVQRDEASCIHCGLCVPYCPSGVFQQDEALTVTDEPGKCIECGACINICPQRAITVRG